MTEKARVRLGAYFLFALLLLAVPLALVLTHQDVRRHAEQWVSTPTGVKLVNADHRPQGTEFARRTLGLSKDGAQQYVHRVEERQQAKLDVSREIKYGTQIDYYTVDGTGGTEKAELTGSAILRPAASPEATEYVYAMRVMAAEKKSPELLDTLNTTLKKGFVLVPTAFASSRAASAKSAGGTRDRVKAVTTHYKVAIVCTKLPGYRDASPRSDGNTNPNDNVGMSVDYLTGASAAAGAEIVYRQSDAPTPAPVAPSKGIWNYADRTQGGTDEPYDVTAGAPFGSLFDSPGGSCPAGIPRGIQTGAWDFLDPSVFPAASRDNTVKLQEYFFNLVYDQALTANSLSNMFYQQTHGNVRVDGSQADVIGWLISAHQLNRYRYQLDGGNTLFVFPGTPVIRRFPDSHLPDTGGTTHTSDPASAILPQANVIVRASMYENGVTVLFSRPKSTLYNSEITLNAYTAQDTLTDNTARDAAPPGAPLVTVGTQPGIVTVSPPAGAAQPIGDPYDTRRWYIPIAGWTFPKRNFNTTAPFAEIAATATVWTGAIDGAWSLGVSGYVTLDSLGTGGTYQRAQRRGCPGLQNTIITDEDTQIAPAGTSGSGETVTFGNRDFARLKSLDYYTREYVPSETFQLSHMRTPTGETDDISGNTFNNSWGHPNPYGLGQVGGDRCPRPYPFDHDSSDSDPWNGGYWPVGGATDTNPMTQTVPPTVGNNTANHTIGAYEGDVNKVLTDNGLGLAGYAVTVYINAGDNGSGEAVTGGFQPMSPALALGETGGPIRHEMAHRILGAVDLYDNDLYANGLAVPPPVPRYRECAAMNIYSLMDAGGRLDAYHQEAHPSWCSVTTITEDTLGLQIPFVEGMLRDPVLVKVPANPYYLLKNKQGGGSWGDWQEYFLLENRERNSTNGSGAYSQDTSPKGLYIYHIDKRNLALNNVNQAGFQRDDDFLTVIIEQADGLHELEFNLKGNGGTATGDPFGGGTACNVDRFWQFPYVDGETNGLGQRVNIPLNGASLGKSPTSYSHGYSYGEQGGGSASDQPVVIPTTATDSFARIVNISQIGDDMTADIYVQPAELVATGSSLIPSVAITNIARVALTHVVTVTTGVAHGLVVGNSVAVSGVTTSTFNGIFTVVSTPDTTHFTYAQNGVDATSSGGTSTLAAQQGQRDVGVMRLVLQNPDGTADPNDYSAMSSKDVYLDELHLLESGTSINPTDVERAKLYLDSNANNTFEAVGDTLLASVPLSNTDIADFTSLGYRIPLASTATLFLVYDIAPEAQTNPRISLGGEFTSVRQIGPRLPGSIQERVRNAGQPYSFGASRFPIYSNTTTVVGYPDVLVITPSTAGLPSKAAQSQANLPMLKLGCAVAQRAASTGGSVRIDSIKVDAVAGATHINAVSDVVNATLYLDNGDGSFDTAGDTLLGTSSFTPQALTLGRANFPSLNLTIDYGTPKNLWLAVTIASSADTSGKTLQLSLDFTPGSAQPQTDCYVQLINSTIEANGNKDYVEWLTANGATWPMLSQEVIIITPNQVPFAPIAPFGPATGTQISTLTPALSWSMPVPPDPDAGDILSSLHYEIQLADNAAFTTPMNGTTADGVMTWDVPGGTPLTVNTDYWWRVRAVDSQDANSNWSPTLTFRVVSNRPPNQILAGFSPVGDITTRTPGTVVASGGDSDPTSPVTWDKATDPDASDTQASLRYVLQIDDNGDFSSPVTLTHIGGGAGQWASYDVVNHWAVSHADQSDYAVIIGDGLTWGTPYFYHVAAMDSAGAQGPWSARQSFVPYQDHRPNRPIAAFSPAGDIEVTTANPVLTWNMPVPPDTDSTDPLATLHYEAQLKEGTPPTDADMTNPAVTLILYVTADGSQQWVVTQDKDSTPVNLIDNGHYFWRVRAVDDQSLLSDWSPVQSFYVNTVNNPPNPPNAGFTPSNNTQINDATPTLSWYAATDPDPTDTAPTLHYVVEMSKDDFATAASYQYTTLDGVLNVTATTPLTDLSTWYWRVKTVDDEGAESAWSATQHFRLDTNNTPPTLTNPTVTPLYGDIGTYFQFSVTYTDAENDSEGTVFCAIDSPAMVLTMAKRTPADNDATDGIVYVVGLPGATLGLGLHNHAFYCDGGTPGDVIVRLPTTGFDFGPVVTSVPSTTSFCADLGGTPLVGNYEEGQPIFVKVDDAGHSTSVPVTVTESGGDTETFLLAETGAGTHVFTGSIGTLGRAGSANNGTLNAIGGPTGNLLTATYTDPFDTTNPTKDISTAQATLADTVAPGVISKKLTVTSGNDGRTADLAWSAYNEAAEVDVAGYHVYYQSADFTSTAGMTEVATLTAGTTTYTVPDLTPNKVYYFAIAAFDEVPNEKQAVIARRLVTRDINPPVFSQFSPTDGATEVARDTTLSFYLDDIGVGVDRSSINITVTQDGVNVPLGPLAFQGTNFSLKVTATPVDLLNWNADVAIQVTVDDLSGNSASATTWDFKTVADTDAPTIDQQSPAPGSTNVAVASNLSFHAKDTKSGIDRVEVTFNGTDVTSSLIITGAATDRTVVYDPSDFDYSTTYTVVATVWDAAGNKYGPITWTFTTVEDATGVLVDQYVPAKDATDVPIDTTIAFRLSDAQSGIDVSTLRVWVQTVEVTGSLVVGPAPLPALPKTVEVLYTPAATFPYSSDIPVRVYVKDDVGTATDVNYKFRTTDAPTYFIGGTITDTTGAKLPGVTMTAGGKTAVSDGTGAYRITGLLAGTYTVTPVRDQYVFTQASRNVTLPGPADDQTGIDFVGRLQTYALYGQVMEGDLPVAAATINCTDGPLTVAPVQTDADGRYSIAGLPNGRYTITPVKANFHFQPTSRGAQIESTDLYRVDFSAVADTFTITGTVKDNLGAQLGGVRVTAGIAGAATNSAEAVTNAAGVYVLTGLRAGTYQVAALKSGFSLEPATQQVTVPLSKTGVDFTALVEMTNTFPAGVNFLGVPGVPANTDPVAAFGTSFVYRWNPETTPPQYLVGLNNPTSEVFRVKPGRGYFVRYTAATTVRVPGVPTAAGSSTSIGLTEGWNMIANPFSTPTKFANFVSSVADGIRPFAFVYDNGTGSYKMVSGSASVSADRDTLLGWEGAWVRAVAGGVSLLVGSSGTSAASLKPAEVDRNGGWVIPIVVRAGNRADLTSAAGVVPASNGNHTVENPPTAPATVDLYFTTAAGQRLAHDIRSQAGAQTYDFVVACAVPDKPVSISLPDLSEVPNNMQVLLVDREAGKTIYARTLSSYTYQSKGDSGERKFQLVVSPRTIGALMVSAAAANRGDSVMLTYSVTKACRMNISVANLAGRQIRQLATGKAVTAGVQTELWNLTSEAGTRVPAGVYLLQMDAVTDSGQHVRGLTQVRVGQ